MSKISVTTIAGLTSGGDANKVKIESGDTFEALSNATVGGTLGVDGHGSIGNSTTVAGTRALTVVGASDGSGSEILNCYNSSLASKFSVRDDGIINAANLILVPTGIRVGGTASGNTLDDYEEGTWTPTLVSTGATFAYSVRQGIYTKIGDLVTFNCVIQLDGGGNSFTGNSVALNGWPFPSRNSQGAASRFFISGRYLNLDLGNGYTYAYADLAGNSSSAPLKESGDNVPTANLTSNDLSSSSGQLYLHGHYYTDS